MKNNRLTPVIFAIVCGIIIAAFGCGGGSSAEKLATNEILGNLPNLVYQKAFSDSVRRDQRDVEMDKLKGSNISDWEKAAKITEKYKIHKKEEDAKFEAEIEKIKPQLVGKDIPFEVEEGLGYEVTSGKITDVSSNGLVSVEVEVKITDIKTADIPRFSKKLITKVLEIDKNGNQIGTENVFYVDLTDSENGATGKATKYIYVSKEKVDFAKIKFIKAK